MTVKVGTKFLTNSTGWSKVEAARRKIKMKDACREAFEAWLHARDTAPSAEFQEQMRIVREGMQRYHDTLREVSR